VTQDEGKTLVVVVVVARSVTKTNTDYKAYRL